MAEIEPKGIVRRVVRYVPEADEAVREAASALGITANDAANQAAIVYRDLVDLAASPRRALMIFNLDTHEIEGEVFINPDATVPMGEKSNVIPFPVQPDLDIS
jgi:hypothetical protein